MLGGLSTNSAPPMAVFARFSQTWPKQAGFRDASRKVTTDQPAVTPLSHNGQMAHLWASRAIAKSRCTDVGIRQNPPAPPMAADRGRLGRSPWMVVVRSSVELRGTGYESRGAFGAARCKLRRDRVGVYSCLCADRRVFAARRKYRHAGGRVPICHLSRCDFQCLGCDARGKCHLSDRAFKHRRGLCGPP